MLTLALIAITVIVSLAAWRKPGLLDSLIFWGPGIARGQWWRLLTHGFIHADGAHLLFNMVTLFFFGTFMERVLTPAIGASGYILFYLAGLVLASMPDFLRHRNDHHYRSLGASGAVSAILFAYILLQPWAMLYVMFVPVPAIVFAALYIGYSLYANKLRQDNINHAAHLSGAVWGVAFMLILQPALLPRFFEQLLNVPYFR